MAEAEDIKNPNDLVKLVNISGEGSTKEGPNKKEDVIFQWDHQTYVVKEHIFPSRSVAIHGIKKTTKLADGRQMLKIVELPANQRQPQTFTGGVPADYEAIKKENEELKAKLAKSQK